MKRGVALFKGWREWLFRPVVVRLVTGLILLVISLTFAPVRQWLFPPRTIASYPLICAFEPHPHEDGKTLVVDLFIINRTQQPYSYEELCEILNAGNSDPERHPVPDLFLELPHSGPFRFTGLSCDCDFNESKGELKCGVPTEGEKLSIAVMSIESRAILKAEVLVEVPAHRKADTVCRASKTAIPFSFDEYESAAYSRDS